MKNKIDKLNDVISKLFDTLPVLGDNTPLPDSVETFSVLKDWRYLDKHPHVALVKHFCCGSEIYIFKFPVGHVKNPSLLLVEGHGVSTTVSLIRFTIQSNLQSLHTTKNDYRSDKTDITKFINDTVMTRITQLIYKIDKLFIEREDEDQLENIMKMKVNWRIL